MANLPAIAWTRMLALWRMGLIGPYHAARTAYVQMSAMIKPPPFEQLFPMEHLLATGGAPKRVTLGEAFGALEL